MRIVCASLLHAFALLNLLLDSASCAYDAHGHSKLEELFGGIKVKHWLHEGLGSSEAAKQAFASPDGSKHGQTNQRVNIRKHLILKWKNFGKKNAFFAVDAVPADHRKIGRWDSQQYVKAATSSQKRGKKLAPSSYSPKKRILVLPPDESPRNEFVAGGGGLGPAYSGRNEFPSGTIGDNIEFPGHEADRGTSTLVENLPAFEDPQSVEESMTAEGEVPPALPGAEDLQLAPAPLDLSEDWEVLTYQGMAEFLGGQPMD